jgi:hypothetical protein
MDVGVPILGKESVKFDAVLVCRKRSEVAAEPIVDPEHLAGRIREAAQSMIGKLEGAFSLTEADRASLHKAAAMLYTQGRTECLPSSLTMN